jgi:hypothetical protein
MVELRPAAPPPPIRTEAAGSMPWFTVMSRMACTMFSVATAITAAAASSTASPSGLARLRSTALRAAAASSRTEPPRKCAGSRWPSTSEQSVTVGSVPPLP